MEIQSFIYKMRDFNSVELADGIFLFKAPKGKWELWNVEDDVEEGEIIDDLKNHPKAVELIRELEGIDCTFCGGRGASGLNTIEIRGRGIGVKSGRRGKGKMDRENLPARMNNRIKVKTLENAIAEFRKLHGKDGKESLIQVDTQGFVHGYTHGRAHSVSPAKIHKGALAIHNHPSNSTFSLADLQTTASTHARGVVATHSKGYRIFEKGNRFDSTGFTKDVVKAHRTALKGKNPNDAIDRWLKRNQKKYGYTFKNVLD